MAVNLKPSEQIRLLETIERLTQAGIPQKGIAEQLQKYGSKKEKSVGALCALSIKKGQTFSRPLDAILSNTAYLALQSGEQAGDFALGVTDAISALNLTKSSTGTLGLVLVKPLLGIVSLLSLSALTSAFLFPKLAEQLPRRRWGALSSFADGVGQWVLSYGWGVAVLAACVAFAVTLSLARWAGKSRGAVDSFIIFRQYRYIHCTNLLTAVAHQVAMGIPLKQALTYYQSNASPYLRFHITAMLNQIKQGKTNVGDIFDTGLLLDEEMDSLKILGEVGDADITLKKSALMHAQKLQHEIRTVKVLGSSVFKLFAAIIGLILVFGLITLFFNISTNFI